MRVLAHAIGATPNETQAAHFTPAHFAAVAPRAWAAALGAERDAAARPWLIVRDPWSRALSAFRYLARGAARADSSANPSGAAGRWWVEGVHPLDVSMGRRLRAAFGAFDLKGEGTICASEVRVALELVRYWRAEEEKQRKREAAERHERHERVMLLGVDDELPRKHDGEARSVCFSFLLKGACSHAGFRERERQGGGGGLNVYVSNLPVSATEDDLWRDFGVYGGSTR